MSTSKSPKGTEYIEQQNTCYKINVFHSTEYDRISKIERTHVLCYCVHLKIITENLLIR